MVDIGVAGEEAAHKEYIVHLPPKWQRFHEKDGRRIKPLTQKYKTGFTHMLTMGRAKESSTDAMPAAKKTVTEGKCQRLQELLALKEEAEQKEQARMETSRLARIVAMHKDKIRRRKERDLFLSSTTDSNTKYQLLLMGLQSETIRRSEEATDKFKGSETKLVQKLQDQQQKQIKNTERRLLDLSSGQGRAGTNSKTLGLLQQVAKEGSNTDAFFANVGRPPPTYDPVKKCAGQISVDLRKQREMETEDKQRRVHERLQKEVEKQEAVVESVISRHQQLQTRREAKIQETKEKIALAQSRKPDAGGHYSYARKVVESRQEEAALKYYESKKYREQRQEEQRERKWDAYEKSLQERYHWLIQHHTTVVKNSSKNADQLAADTTARNAEAKERRELQLLDQQDRQREKHRHEEAVEDRKKELSVKAEQKLKQLEKKNQLQPVSNSTATPLVNITRRKTIVQNKLTEHNESDRQYRFELEKHRIDSEYSLDQARAQKRSEQLLRCKKHTDEYASKLNMMHSHIQESQNVNEQKVNSNLKATHQRLLQQRREEREERKQVAEANLKRSEQTVLKRDEIDSSKLERISQVLAQNEIVRNRGILVAEKVKNQRQQEQREKTMKSEYMRRHVAEEESVAEIRDRQHLQEKEAISDQTQTNLQQLRLEKSAVKLQRQNDIGERQKRDFKVNQETRRLQLTSTDAAGETRQKIAEENRLREQEIRTERRKELALTDKVSDNIHELYYKREQQFQAFENKKKKEETRQRKLQSDKAAALQKKIEARNELTLVRSLSPIQRALSPALAPSSQKDL